ncbi:hypothetical protein CR970_03655 [Candidatus Saccharibacteria bacterium]|nr:MAG: hypothetical protein CR970_03655 [Candidatus Saccharibacteria bacterium]
MTVRVKAFLSHNWRPILNVLTIVAMVALVYALREQILDTLRNLGNVQWWALLLMIPLQIANYDAYARMYRSILQHLKHRVSYRDMYRVTLELTFVNHAFPSGGISGISYFGLRLKSFGVRASASTLVQLIKFVLIFISFQILIAFGLLALAIGGKANNVMLLFAGVLATLTVVGTLLGGYIVGDKQRIKSTFRTLTNWANRAIRLVRRGTPEAISIQRLEGFANDMHDDFRELRTDPRLIKRLVWLGLAANVTEILTLYMVYLAFGEWVNVGAVIIAYAVANFAGLIAVLPGGVGVYEVLMTGILAAGGIPVALSIPVVVMYRVLSMAIQLIPGGILYHKALVDSHAKKQP